MTAPKATFPTLRVVLQNLGIFAGILLVLVIIANWPALSHLATAESVISESIANTNPKPIDGPDSVIVESLGINAPLVLNTPADAMPTALGEGVAHLEGTALPGERGNSVLIGHSSDYTWKRNPYAAVFSLLPRLKTGDTFTVRYQGVLQTYTVAETKIVRADDLSVLNQGDTAQVTLLTCYPIGTTWKRFIVIGNLQGDAKEPASGLMPAPALNELKIR